MRKKIIMDENRWLLEAITEEYETICTHAEKIPKIEIDILMENVRKFYENLRILQRLDDPHLTEEHLPVPHSAVPRAEVTIPEKPVVGSPEPNIAAKPIIPPIPQVAANPPVIKPADPPEIKPVEPPMIKPAEPPVKRTETPQQVKRNVRLQEIDLFAQEEPTHNMKLQDARERAFSPKIPGNRIDNLKMGIPINDKFMFINDLFDGNLREYNETIEALNGFKTLDQAAEYLDLMKRKNLWNTASIAFLKLKELVERHY